MSSDFHTTHWSVVLTAKGDDTAAREALSTLCETYYQPVLRYIERSTGMDSAQRYGGRDARDLTHDFFTQLLEGEMFSQLQKRERKLFRSYLLGAVRHFLSVVRNREQADKRGGEAVFVSLQLQTSEPAAPESDDALFDRDWAQATIDRAMQQLEAVHDNTPAQALLPWLSKTLTATDRVTLSQTLNMNDTAIKVLVHRLRKKFRELVKSIIAETVEHPSEIDAELARLVKALNF